MADEKKPAAAPPPPAEKKDSFVEIIWMLAIVFIVISLFNGISSAITRSRIFSNGLSSLSKREIMLSNTLPISALLNPIGVKILSINDTNVYDSPGGKKVGEQKMGSRGVILQGPVVIDAERYWYVDYDKGVDGWVNETDIRYVDREPSWLQRMVLYIGDIVWYIKIFAALLFVVAAVCIVLLFRKINAISENERKMLYPEDVKVVNNVNPKWANILDHIESLNENDWRQGILEADIMLDDLLKAMALPGETLGDRLKAVEKSDFTTIDNAWEAHKIRNQIAHEGQAFLLNQREARRVIALYQTVFEEFQVI